ncbi:MAG TPA: hypothetical protein VL728_00610 [Cyclobacteriaceae bacterium]|nr:hypothetical protein [Cyclobacteriaceae bacterium]
MKKIALAFLVIGLMNASYAQSRRDRAVGGGCEACDEMYEGMPQNLSWQTTITDANEPGERMIIKGTIFKKDGKTPAPNVILYVYHTDNKGLYSRSPNQTQALRHGHLRGWMKSDDRGRYEFRTIRPASYPNRRAPQHIHPLIKEEGLMRYWIDEYLFDDDPLLTNEEKSKQSNRGGSGIVHLIKENGVWIGKRDITLGMNIPGY